MDVVDEFLAALAALVNEARPAKEKAIQLLDAAKVCDNLLDLEELCTWFEWDDAGNLIVTDEL